ncbi:unnamed protein product [Gadus morhua 'NCC']
MFRAPPTRVSYPSGLCHLCTESCLADALVHSLPEQPYDSLPGHDLSVANPAAPASTPPSPPRATCHAIHSLRLTPHSSPPPFPSSPPSMLGDKEVSEPAVL